MPSVLIVALLWLSPATAHAADFNWHDTKGKVFSLADYRDKPVALHFWASWCPPCRAELPELDTWIKAHPDARVIPISLDANGKTATDFVNTHGLVMQALLADSREAKGIGVRGLPSTIIIGSDGGIMNNYTGPLPWKQAGFSHMILKKLVSQPE